MRLRSFAFPSVTIGSVVVVVGVSPGEGGFWVSFSPRSHCEESFHSLGAQCLGFSVH